jgi:hypothetical protein
MADPRLDGGVRTVELDRELTAQQGCRIEIAEHEVGVSDGGILAASAVAGWAGFGSRAPRAHTEGTTGIDPGNAAAPGADLCQVDHGNADGMTGAV